MSEPTAEGRKRYQENNGYYIADANDLRPCTCVESCNNPCKGECGCEACRTAYGDFLSGD